MNGHHGLPAAQRTGATLTLKPDPRAVREARAFVAGHCRTSVVREETREVAVLLTSEVVTNAFLHGRSQTQVSVVITSTCVRVEVKDDNSRHPTVVARDDDALDGRGMALVDILATTWGSREEDIGKTVWFELHS